MELRRVELLASHVVDQIAAGEVVERPSHLVKELVENSLDAGATSLIVDVGSGGRFVRVQDNGHGIEADDFNLILKRHTTSKIRQSEDLWNLVSFGFRGEALASIAAVSILKLSSKRKGKKQAYRLESQFGKEMGPDPVSHEVGTTVEIAELFENLPARLKFLKSASAETTAIRNILKAMALSRPDVEVRFRVEGALDFYYPGGQSRLERAKEVLAHTGLFESSIEYEGVQVKAVFSDPHYTQKTSRSIWISVQGRVVQDRGLQAAIMEAYRNTLMHGEYPMVALWVELPPDQVDVNIHPTKSQVKFLTPSKVFSAVHRCLRQGLEANFQKAEKVVEALPENLTFNPADLGGVQFQQKNLAPTRQSSLFESRLAEPGRVYQSLENAAASRANTTEEPKKAGSGLPNFAVKTPSATSASISTEIGAQRGPGVSPSLRTWSDLQVLGQAHLTYMICQNHEGLVLVDQHAAHERVLFESIVGAWDKGGLESQALLFPLVLDMTPDQVDALLTETEAFKKLSLEIERMGPQNLGVSSIPSFLKESVLPELMAKIANEILDFGGSFSFEKSLKDIAATMACHSAIRAGQALSHPEMEALLKQMDEFAFSSFCPHGRPVSVKWSLAELEREFGRRPG